MKDLLNPEGVLFQFLSRVGDMIILNVLFLICCVPIVTIGAALIGAVSGVVSHYIVKKEGVLRIILSALSAHIVGSMIVKSFGLYVYYGWGVLVRIPLYIVIAALEITLMCLIFKNKALSKFLCGKGELK